MQGSGSRARMGDLKHIGSARQLSPPRHSASVAALHASASGAALHLASSVSLSLRPVPSSASMVSAAPSPSSSRAQFKSLAVACEIRLKECIERSRVADRLLRAPPATADSAAADHRSASDSLIDRSISALAIVLFDILHQLRDSFPSATLYLQFVSVLDQLVWSTQTRLVTIEQPHTMASSPSTLSLGGASTASLHAYPASVPIVERLTNYELNLLHARNDDSWRTNFHAISEREAALQAQVDSLMRENDALKRDKTSLAQETTAAQDLVRELERVVQSLDGRLRIAQEQHEAVCAQMNALQRLSSEQQEVILHSRQDLLSVRHALEVSQASWSANETQDALRAELKKSEVSVAKLEDQVQSINKLYYGMLATAHTSIQKKESVTAELARAEAKILELTQSREEILRPFTPRPEWSKLYRANICELTPTLLLEAKSPSSTQISALLGHLLAKDDDLARLHDTLGQTLDVQAVLKKDLARSKRDLEIAIRQNIVAQNRIRAAGLPGASGDDPIDLGARISMSTLYMKPKSNARFFTGAGIGKEVPAFLRCAGKIRNRHLSKKDTEMVVREVWARKQQHDRERGRLDMNVADFFYFFLKNKYGLPSLIAEWSYNMLDALERYRWDADCELFLKILLGEVVEEAYYDQCLMMATLTNLFQAMEIIRAERRSTNLTPGSKVDALPMDYIARVLRLLFPAKTEEAFEDICASLQTCFTDSPASISDYSLLFRENRSMSETGFVEAVRDQHLYEIENLCIQLTEEIVLLPRVDGDDSDEEDAAAATPDEKKEGRVRLFDVHNVWMKLDPHITVETMDLHIARALRLPPGSAVDPTMLVKPSDFCHALFSQGLITYTNNFDSSAPQRLGSIPLPDLLVQPPQGLNTLLTSGAHSRGGKSVDRKGSSSSNSFSSIDRKASSMSLSGSLDRKGTLTAASAAAAAALAATSSIASVAEEDESKQAASGGDTPASPLSQSLSPPSAATSSPTASSASSLLPSVGPKKDCLLSTPKILRLRPRFGLDPTPSELLFLERGPGFSDPASLVRAPNKSNTEVETLLAEKAELDAQRFGERVRLMRDKENSMKAIQGIGVLKRRGSSVGGKSLMAVTAALNAAPATLVPTEEKSAITVSVAPSSPARQESIVMIPPNAGSDTTPQPSPRSNRSSLASSSGQTASEGGNASSNLSPSGRPPLHSSPSSSTVLSPSGSVASVLSPTSPMTPPPTYRSSFFAAPSVLQSPDSGVLVVQMGAGGGQGPPHAKSVASFKRRYTDRSNRSAAAVAAAVEQQQQAELLLDQQRSEQAAAVSPNRGSRRRSSGAPLLPSSPTDASTSATPAAPVVPSS